MASVEAVIHGSVDKFFTVEQDMARIVSLPEWVPSAEEQAVLVEKWTNALAIGEHSHKFRPIQAYCFETAALAKVTSPVQGFIAQAGVGQGKTLTFAVLPLVFGAERPVLMLPPQLVKDMQNDRFRWQQYFHLATNITVIPYSELSRPESTALLEKIQPDLIMADECHNLKDPNSARTRRFIRYMEERPTRFVGMSGTLSGGSIKDYAHLMSLGCREYNPTPTHPNLLNKYMAGMDSGAIKKPGDAQQALQVIGPPLIRKYIEPRWYPSGIYIKEDIQKCRQAHAQRLSLAPFTILTESPSVDIPIKFEWHRPDLDEEVTKALGKVNTDYEMPDGELLEDDIEKLSAATQLSNGFYYKWDWPNGKVDEEWMSARSEWCKAIREFLKFRSGPGRDSPKLVKDYVRANKHQENQMYRRLMDWEAQATKPQPPTIPVWMDDRPIIYAAEWLKAQKGPAILWYRFRAVGEALARLGVRVWDDPVPDHKVAPKIALSIKKFGTGKQLQYGWSNQLAMAPGPNALEHEQLYGRTVRPGQEAKEVRFGWFIHTAALRRNIREARLKAEAINENLLQPQLILLYMKDLKEIEE